MRINFPSFNYAIPFFKENVPSFLADQQKKIAVVAAIVFGCFAAYVLINRFCFTARPLDKEENLKEDSIEVEDKDEIPVQENQDPLLPQTIEEKIAAIQNKQIDALAKKIIAKVMSQLQIDVNRNMPIPGKTYSDIKGHIHQVYQDQYKPSSEFMQNLLPLVIKEIKQAFAHPTLFLEKGIEFKFVTPSHGLVDHITNPALQKLIHQKVNEIIKNWKLNTLTFSMTLALNKKWSGQTSELYFDIYTKLNGAQVGHWGGALKLIEKDAAKSII